MIERQLIFKTLDNPARVLFWTIDEFLVMACPFFLGICFGSIILMILPFILKKLYSKIKKKFPYGSMKHALYWYEHPFVLKKVARIKNLPSSHHRELLL